MLKGSYNWNTCYHSDCEEYAIFFFLTLIFFSLLFRLKFSKFFKTQGLYCFRVKGLQTPKGFEFLDKEIPFLSPMFFKLLTS